MKKGYYQYVDDVLSDKIIVGELIKLSCNRFKSDLQRDDLIFKEEVVDNAIGFIGTLKHFTGKSSGKHFKLENWQQFIIANILGWYYKSTGIRRFTSSYIEVSRKNGKTALASALCLYFLIADGEDGAEVDLAANSKEQAKIAFNFCSTYSKQLDSKGKYLEAYRDNIKFNLTNSVLKVFAADDSKLDGFNASFGLVDEYHSAKNSKVRDVIKSSMGMRQNPHLCTITTAGFDKTLPCYKLRSTAIEILNKLKIDDSMFIAIYSLDDTDDWKDQKNWAKCAPNLDITVTSRYIKNQVNSAINNPSEEVGVKTKTLNLWCDVANVWLPENYITKSSTNINLDDFRDCDCYIGVDLSATSDLTAVAYLIEKDNIFYFKVGDLCKTLILKFAHYIIFLYLYGMKQTLSSPSFADVVLGQRKVKQTFFSQIDKLIDWTPIRGIIEIAYTKGYKSTGRPSYDSLILFKIELLRTWYGLSDGEVEEQVNDRLSFSRFVGLGLEDTAPDSTTVCRFRNTLVEAELYDMVLNEINRQLESKGVIVKRGAIIDASITDTPRRPRGRKEYEVVEDRNEADSRDSSEKAMVKEVIKPNVDGDARWIKKMGKLHFGYKRHTVTDENGLILAEETTAANESDIKHLETPLQKANLPVRTPVYADKGYNSSENKEVLTRMKLKSRIMHKGVRGKKITEREQRINVSISKIRYRVERTFGSMHRWFRAGVARYVGLAKTHAQHIMEAVAYNLYRTPGIIVSNSLK